MADNNTNLKYEQINWGWLSDYGGYKFAPITFFENLYTERGTSFEDDLKEGEILVGRAAALARLNENGTSTLYETSSVKPVYFDDGTPVECENIEINLTGNINTLIGDYSNYTINAGTFNGNTFNGGVFSGTSFTGNLIGNVNAIENYSGYTVNAGTFNGTTFNGGAFNGASLTINDSIFFAGELLGTGIVMCNKNVAFGDSLIITLEGNTRFLSLKDPLILGTLSFGTGGRNGRITSSGQTVTISAGDTSEHISLILNAGNKTIKPGYYNGASSPAVDAEGTASGVKIYGAAWNDYAEFRDQWENIEPGYCVCSSDNGKVFKTMEKLAPCDGIVSDTFGFAIGEDNICQTPLAVAGRALAYCEGDRADYHAGDTVCASANGKVCKMTREEIREYPDRIVGVVSEIPQYEIWNNGIEVKGRIWVNVK